MEDRIISANILAGNPKIGFAANNIIKGIEWDENKLGKNVLKLDNYKIDYANDIKIGSSFTYKVIFDKNNYNYKESLLKTSNSNKLEYIVLDNIVEVPDSKITDFVDNEKNYAAFFNSNFISGDIDPSSVTTGATPASSANLMKTTAYYSSNPSLKIKELVLTAAVLPFYCSFSISNGKINVYYAFAVLMNIGNPSNSYKGALQNIEFYFAKDENVFNSTSKPLVKIKPNIAINSNELMQADTKVNGVPIGQYIATNIIEQYKNGKATLNCSIYIDEKTERYKVGDIAKVYGFDGKSVSLYRDGTDKRFKITSAELRYNGQIKQNLEMVEVVNNGIQ